MPSIYPGMDPYLEAQPFWGDFHSTMITAMKAELSTRLPANYSVWSDIYIWLHEPDADTRLGKPDVFATARPKRGRNGTVATLASPVTSMLPAVRREGSKYLKIKEARSDRVVTALELLSPANKNPAEDRDAYLAKRNEYLATGTNLVELDLHRSFPRMPLGKPPPPKKDYCILICRAIDFPSTAIWPLSVRDRLPTIPIPLLPEDGVVELDLQTCFEWTYDHGPYKKEIDYTKPPRPPLARKDAAWARELAKK